MKIVNEQIQIQYKNDLQIQSTFNISSFVSISLYSIITPAVIKHDRVELSKTNL